jgi:DNA-binding LacI/PurR family transcriptional regulator
MILMPPPATSNLPEFLKTKFSEFPLVALDRTIAACPDIPAVLADNMTGISKAMQMFARLGYSKTHFVGANPAIEAVGLRWEGFKTQCHSPTPHYWRVPSFEEPEQLSELDPLIELVKSETKSFRVGIVADDATTTIQVVRRILETSPELPRNLGLLHYDRLEDSKLRDGDYVGLAQRKELLAVDAVTLLLKMIDREPISDDWHCRIIPAIALVPSAARNNGECPDFATNHA